MFLASKAFRVDLINVFGTRGPRREPPVFRNYFYAADFVAVARRGGQDVLNLFSRQIGNRNILWRQFPEPGPLFSVRRRVNPFVRGFPILAGQLCVEFSWIGPCARRDLC